MRVLVIGGTGFIGRQLVGRLVADGHSVHVPTRRYAQGRHLLVYPTATVLEANIQDDKVLLGLIQSCDAVINLVGILHSRSGKPYGADFDAVHVQLPRRIALACQQANVKRLVHVSALGASPTGPSGYLRSKAAGEKAIMEVFAGWPEGHWTIMRPSVVFGEGDQFMNMFATLAKWFPALPLAGSAARLQPVYVDDVAQAIANVLQNPHTFGQCYDLAGPQVYTLGELVSLAATWSLHPRVVIPMPLFIGRLQAFFFECLPGPPLMSRENLDSLRVDNISKDGMDPLLGVVATPLESVAPNYLK